MMQETSAPISLSPSSHVVMPDLFFFAWLLRELGRVVLQAPWRSGELEIFGEQHEWQLHSSSVEL